MWRDANGGAGDDAGLVPRRKSGTGVRGEPLSVLTAPCSQCRAWPHHRATTAFAGALPGPTPTRTTHRTDGEWGLDPGILVSGGPATTYPVSRIQ